MFQIKNHQLFKTICITLIATFVCLDISYAYPPEHNASNSTLAIPSVLQQTPINEQAAQLQESVSYEGELLGSFYSIGKYLLEDRLPIRYLDEVISAELGKKVEDIGLSRVDVKNGIVLIPCVIKGKKRIVQVALKDSLAAKSLIGDEWDASEIYTIKIAPEKKEQLHLDADLIQFGEVFETKLKAIDDMKLHLTKALDFLTRNDPLPSKPDILMVFTSEDTRIPEEAATLYQKLSKENRKPKAVLFSGGSTGSGFNDLKETTGLSGYCEAEIYEALFKKKLEALGMSDVEIKDIKILIESRAANTGDNVKLSRELLEKEGLPFKNVILMTYLHVRAGATFEKEFGYKCACSSYAPDISNMTEEKIKALSYYVIDEVRKVGTYSPSKMGDKAYMNDVIIPQQVTDAVEALKILLINEMVTSVIQERGNIQEVSVEELFALVKFKVTASIKSWTNALNEPSKQFNLSDDTILQAVKQTKEKYKSPNGSLYGSHFQPIYSFVQGKPLDESLIKTKRTAQDVLKLLMDAKKRGIALSITGHLRGLDGPGSTLDAPEFQMRLTKKGVKNLLELPLTPTIASAFDAKIRFELADDENAIEYIAPDYAITRNNPYKVKFNNAGDIKNGQKDVAAFIFGKVFGIRGIRIICEDISPMALAGGMESSNVLNVALITAASMLSGADLSLSDIFSLAVKLENDEFKGLTGGQGHLSCMLGGAYKHIWLSGIKDDKGNSVNPYSAFSVPLLSNEGFRSIEEHVMLVQAGKKYEDGKAVVHRTASLINNMWTDLLKDGDKVSAPLFQEMLKLANQYVNALEVEDYETVVKTMDRYVDIRNLLCKRWMELMLDAHNNRPVPDYAKTYADKVFNGMSRENRDYAFIKDMYDEHGENLRNISLYVLGPIGELVDNARKEGIAVMALGAGGPGANLVAVSPRGAGHLRRFLESQGLLELIEKDARTIITGTGTLKGYMPFKVGKEPLRIVGFKELGLPEPESPSTGTFSIPAAIKNYLAFTELDEKIKKAGFFGPGIKASDRYEYIKLLMDDISLLNHSTMMSSACKEDIRNLPTTRKKSFSHISKHLLIDILNKSTGKAQTLPMPIVADLDYMPNSPTVLLIAPFEKKELKAGSFLAPPLGIYRLANYLRLFGIKVDLFDPNLKGIEALCDFVRKQNTKGGYDFIGFSIYEPTLENDIELAKQVKRISGKSIFIAGGEGAFYNSEKLLTPNSPFSIIYKGFGEFSLLDTLISYMQNGKEYFDDQDKMRGVKSAVVKLKTGEVIETHPQPMITEDDYRVISLFFDSTIVPYEDYWNFMEELYGYGSAEAKAVLDIYAIKTVRLITSSHCPMGCSFCSSTNFLKDSIDSRRQRVLSLTPKEIIEILKNIKKYHSEVKTIFFNDDDFMINPNRVKELCGLIKKEFGANVFRFIALGRVDKVDKELLEKMKEAGFIQLNYGIESFSDNILIDMNKGITAEENIDGLNATLQAGILPMIALIPFYPTTKMNDAKKTIDASVEFAAKGAELSYWPFVEAFKGASIMKKVKSEKNPKGEYELSENGKDILPVDIEVRSLAKEAIRNKDAVIQEIKAKYAIKGKIPHVVDVLAFFIAFYRAAGESTNRIEEVIEGRLSGHVQQIKAVTVGSTQLNVIATERIDHGLIEPQKPVDFIAGDEKLADEELKAGHVGVITVAGGLSSRAGIEYPKGMHPITPISSKTLFQTRAEEIKAASEYYGKSIPWIIMTSDANDKITHDYFKENNFFDLGEENIIFIKATNVPALLAGTQQLAMKDANQILLTSGGHGNIYNAMKNLSMRSRGGKFGKLSALDEAKRRGVETFIYCQIDNAMPVIHRQVLGAHLREESEFTTVSVRKRDREENLGMPVVSTLIGKHFYVEYNQPGGEALKHKEGFDSGACGIFILSRSFLERIDQPPYHLVRKKKSEIYKNGKIQQDFIDKYESFMFDVLPKAKKSVNILFPREECFAPFKNMEGPDSPETVAEAVSNYWKSVVKRALPEIEIPPTAIIELPRSSEYMRSEKLKNKLLALNLPGKLKEGVSILVSDDFNSISTNLLDLSGNSRILTGRLLTEKLSLYERVMLKRAILEKYREEQKVGAIEKFRYPHSDNDWKSADNALVSAREKYTETGRPLFLEGVTLIYKPRDDKYGLFRKAIEKINSWNTAEEPLIATVALGSEHITLYDLACMLDWEKKYKNQFNQSTKDEIGNKTKELFSTGRFKTEDNAREQATYEIITRKANKVLKNFKADRTPIFKPSNIVISMPPFGPFAVLLSMKPKTAEDLAIITKIQDAIRNETGIENTEAFKAHITLGYIVNSIYKDKRVFSGFMQHIAELDTYIRKESALPKHEFTSPQMDLCYLDNLDNYQSIGAFSWIDSNTNIVEGVDTEKRLAEVQKSAHSKFSSTYNQSKMPQLFAVAESFVNNERAKFIESGNKVINSLATKTTSGSVIDIGIVDKKMATAEIKKRVEKAISIVEGIEKKVSPETRASIELLKKNLNQFEADGAVASLIVLARRAQRENQKLIIGLETDWIPGMNVKGSLQRNAIAALMKEIDEIGEALKSMGLDNVEIIRGNRDGLSNALLTEANKTHTNLHNIVVMASANTINSDTFATLRNANENDKPFLAGIDPTELIKLYTEFGEATSKQLYIRLTQMLYMTLELAAGKEPPQLPIIVSYDKKMRMVIFLPKAEPIDYEVLKNTYAAEKMALSAA